VTAVTDRTATERQRRRRERLREAAEVQSPSLFEQADWRLFMRRETLPQKAGCEPRQVGRIVLKELADNALDTGSANVEVAALTKHSYRVTDHGPGIAAADVVRLFAVNRPLLSSKLKRLPLRGMLGNGLRVVMGAVAAFDGMIRVTSRGRCLSLAIDKVTGTTAIAKDQTVPTIVGSTVEILLSCFDGSELEFAERAIEIANSGTHYTGPSQPAWYSVEDLREMMAQVTPPDTTVARLACEVFDLNLKDGRVAAKLDAAEVGKLHLQLLKLAVVSAGAKIPH
jgi:hypothetical protein